MSALNVHYPPSEGVEGCLAPGASRASPPDLPVSSTAVEAKPVASDVDAHLPLLAEAVGGEAVDAGADQTDCNKRVR